MCPLEGGCVAGALFLKGYRAVKVWETLTWILTEDFLFGLV